MALSILPDKLVSAHDEEFLTVAEIAGILKLNQQTVRNWIDQGTLPALHIGRRVRVRCADFDALVERGRTARKRVTERSDAQALWEGDLLPRPMLNPGEG